MNQLPGGLAFIVILFWMRGLRLPLWFVRYLNWKPSSKDLMPESGEPGCIFRVERVEGPFGVLEPPAGMSRDGA